MNVNEMTHEEIREELARLDRWIRLERSNDIFEHKDTGEIHASDGEVADHPFPATLDGAARALPKGWRLERLAQSAVWSAYASRAGPYNARMIVDADDELTARYRLALACRLAEAAE